MNEDTYFEVRVSRSKWDGSKPVDSEYVLIVEAKDLGSAQKIAKDEMVHTETCHDTIVGISQREDIMDVLPQVECTDCPGLLYRN